MKRLTLFLLFTALSLSIIAQTAREDIAANKYLA